MYRIAVVALSALLWACTESNSSAKTKGPTTTAPGLIGTWSFPAKPNPSLLASTIRIFKRGESYRCEETFKVDGSVSKHNLTYSDIDGRRSYVKKGSRDYFLMTNGGDLACWDEQGFIGMAVKR